jgi:hypothetical protein
VRDVVAACDFAHRLAGVLFHELDVHGVEPLFGGFETVDEGRILHQFGACIWAGIHGFGTAAASRASLKANADWFGRELGRHPPLRARA